MLSQSVMSDSAIPWTVASEAPLSMGFSRQEYWRGLPFPSPGDLPDSEIEPWSPASQADSLPAELEGSPFIRDLLLLFNHSVVSDSLQPHRLKPARLLSPWDSPGKNPGVGCHALLQGVFPTQGSNPGVLHWQVHSLPLMFIWKPVVLKQGSSLTCP